jgi:hypothetical protein
MITMKEMEKGGGDFISFLELEVVVAYYMIIMKEVEKGGGDFMSFNAPGSRSYILYNYYDYYEKRWRREEKSLCLFMCQR